MDLKTFKSKVQLFTGLRDLSFVKSRDGKLRLCVGVVYGNVWAMQLLVSGESLKSFESGNMSKEDLVLTTLLKSNRLMGNIGNHKVAITAYPGKTRTLITDSYTNVKVMCSVIVNIL